MLAKLLCRRSSHDQRCPAPLPSKYMMDLFVYLDLLDVRGCYSGGSIPGRDEPGPRYISPYFNGYIGRFVTGKFKIHN